MARFCINCGQEFESDEKVCKNCGKEQSKEIAKKESSKKGTSSVAPKNKIIAGGLGIFLGCFGVHNFYLGYYGKAVAQLLITVLSCFILSPISIIWGIIEGALILLGQINVDAEGNPIED